MLRITSLLAGSVLWTLSLMLALSAGAAGTVTFTADDSGTFPRTLKLDTASRRLTVQLTVIPPEARIFRAELVLRPVLSDGHQRPFEPTCVYPEGQPNQPLKFVAPRFVSLDALAAVQAAVKSRQPLLLQVQTTCRGVERLEVSWDAAQPRGNQLPGVSELRVSHRAGQTFVVFREPDLEAMPVFHTGAAVRAWAKRVQEQHPDLTFRIWRGAQRLTSTTICEAQLVGECGLLTCWNSGYHQDETDKRAPVRFRVTDGGPELPWGTGVYAHNPLAAGNAYYAVTVALRGEEDFTRLGVGNTTAEPVAETVGPGEPILQGRETPQEWLYRRATAEGRLTRLIYTRWEAWPRSPVPSQPIDYLVALANQPRPETPAREPESRAYRVSPAPVGLHLHCWGGSLNGGYGWWYNAHRGAVLIASNQVPYDWWTGHHQALGTRQTWGDGGVREFTTERLLSFLDWAARQWQEAPPSLRQDWPQLDLTRVFTAGSSMGGSGAPMFALRHGDRIAWGLGWVGVHVPNETPQFQGSYAGVYGPPDARITMSDGRTSPWDYFSDVWWLRNHPAQETGLVIASNGKNDSGIGWPQAVRFARALQETRRPHIFNWALGGHGTRTLVGANFDLDLRTDQSLPAFTNGTLDNRIGTGQPKSPEERDADRRRQELAVQAGRAREVQVDPYDGDPTGAYNAHLSWEPETLVDTADTWELTVVLQRTAPEDHCRVDVTPRRLQRLKLLPNARFSYTVTSLETQRELDRGIATVDEQRLLTLRQIPLFAGRNRLHVAAVP